MQGEQLGRRQPRLVAEQLGQVADAGPGRGVGGRAAEQQHLPGVGVDEAEQHLDDGGLAGAVGPEQADDLAAADRQRHVVHGRAPRRTACAGPSTRRRARPAGRRPGGRPGDRGGGRGGHRRPRATARTSSSSSEPATTVSVAVAHPHHAGQRAVGQARAAWRAARRPSSTGSCTWSDGTGSGRVEPSPAKVRSCAATSSGRPGSDSRWSRSVANGTPADDAAVGATARATTSAGAPDDDAQTCATPGPASSRTCAPSSPAGAGGPPARAAPLGGEGEDGGGASAHRDVRRAGDAAGQVGDLGHVQAGLGPRRPRRPRPRARRGRWRRPGRRRPTGRAGRRGRRGRSGPGPPPACGRRQPVVGRGRARAGQDDGAREERRGRTPQQGARCAGAGARRAAGRAGAPPSRAPGGVDVERRRPAAAGRPARGRRRRGRRPAARGRCRRTRRGAGRGRRRRPARRAGGAARRRQGVAWSSISLRRAVSARRTVVPTLPGERSRAAATSA